MKSPFENYVLLFENMKCNKQKGIVAPHKAIMLLTVMHCVSKGLITNGFIPHNDMIVKEFEHLWIKYIGHSIYFNPVFSTPFFHLSNEPFWSLMKTEDYVQRQEYSIGQLRKNFFGAKLPDDLWQLMLDTESRESLSQILIYKYCSESQIRLKVTEGNS